jgi:hypothetical protein
MDRGRVGEDRGSKETDGCPLTTAHTSSPSALQSCVFHMYRGAVMSHIILTPETLLMNQHPLHYTAATVFTTAAAFY